MKKIDELIKKFEATNCRNNHPHSLLCAKEINPVLASIAALPLAIDLSTPDASDGSDLFLISYYMILKLSKRISELENKLEEKL